MILEEIKNIKSDKTELKKFGRTIGIVLVLLGLVLLYSESSFYAYFLIVAAVFILSGFMAPAILLPFQKVWMTFTVLLGFVMTRVILSILFYLVFTPMKLIAGLFGKRFLDLRFKKNVESYWNKREVKPYEQIDSERQF
ncbi:SxtJ family membrane protein [Bacteroidota bacterium]